MLEFIASDELEHQQFNFRVLYLYHERIRIFTKYHFSGLISSPSLYPVFMIDMENVLKYTLDMCFTDIHHPVWFDTQLEKPEISSLLGDKVKLWIRGEGGGGANV